MPTVLVVDDEAPMRSAIRATLERAGLIVLEARSASEALTIAATRPEVDVVVSDVHMPLMNGLAFHDKLISATPRLAGRVIFLTGSAGDSLVHAPIEDRQVPLLSKVGDPRLVVDAVRVALLTRSPTRQ
jgi:CheY-like chemotaxis protein